MSVSLRMTTLEKILDFEKNPADIDDFLENGKWKCIACGACCKNMGWALPHWTLEDGKTCKHLQEDMKCGIYNHRPLICHAKVSMTAAGQKWDERKAAALCSHLRKGVEDGE